MKLFNIYDKYGIKIAEMAEFSDGWAFLHYIVDNFPKNQFAKAQSLKVQMTKNGWKYERYEPK